MKGFMITKNPVVEIQNLIMNDGSSLVKSNPTDTAKVYDTFKCKYFAPEVVNCY